MSSSMELEILDKIIFRNLLVFGWTIREVRKILALDGKKVQSRQLSLLAPVFPTGASGWLS